MDPKSVLETNLERLFARAYVPIEPSPEFRSRLLQALRNRPLRAARPRIPVSLRIAAAAAIALAAGIVLWRTSRSDVRTASETLVESHSALPGDPSPEARLPRPDDAGDAGSGALPGTAVADRGLDAASPADPGRTGAGAPSTPETVERPAPAPSEAVLRGRVSAGPDEEPPASYVVTLLRAERLPAVSQPEPHECTGASFAVERLRPGTYTVFVRAPGFSTWQRGGVELRPGVDGVDLEVLLERGASVRGRVLDAAGRPVEGATVLSETDTPSQLLPFSGEGDGPTSFVAATSLADGTFELGPLSHARQRLRATRAGHGAAWSGPLDLSADPSAEVVLRLVRPGAIEGRVARDDGSPWPGAVVVASWLDTSANYLDRQCLNFGTAVADAMGNYEIADLPPGLFVVLNVMEGRGSGANRVPNVQQVRLVEGARVRADLPGGERGTSVEGTLVGSDGQPLAGRDVTFLLTQGADTEWKSTRSRDDGRFDFPSLVPGTYLVFAGGNLGTELAYQSEVEVPAVPVFRPVVRSGTGVLRGRVTEAETGKGLPSSVLILEMDTADGSMFAGRIVSDAEGRYTLSLLLAGSYRVTAYATAGRLGQESAYPVEVREGEEPATRDFALRPGASIAVRVRDEADRPIPGAAVRFVDAAGFLVGFSPDDHTDSKGVFDVRGAKPGRWTLRVEHAGFEPSETVLDLAVGEDRSVEIRLHPVR